MFTLMIFIFVAGYIAIAFEHTVKVDKAATALITATLCWTVFVLSGGETLFSDDQLVRHLGSIGEILFFLMGAMTIVEIVDQHQGFNIITDRIHTTGKVKLLWTVTFITFFLSAVLDNLTTAIILVTLLQKIIKQKKIRWIFAGMIILSANAGGAWSPIGDITTIMLWIGGQITAFQIIKGLFLPSLASILVPLIILSLTLKGNVLRPSSAVSEQLVIPVQERALMLVLGVGGLLFVPVFKMMTHLPPYLGILLVLGILWIVSDRAGNNKPEEIRGKFRVAAVLKRIDVPTILFFLGILLSVAALESAGHLHLMSQFLDEKIHNVYLINIAIGVLSSVVDNVPLVAGAMGMYPVADPASTGYLAHFVQNGVFWEFLAYTAGTGGSMLIIGSAAGVAVMGLEKIDFMWYLRHISWLAAAGFLAGAGVYFLMTA